MHQFGLESSDIYQTSKMYSEQKLNKTGQVVWITGLSGAGKSTLAKEFINQLHSHGRSAILLDGDELREVFAAVESNYENHGRNGRLSLAMRYARLCKLLSTQGLTVVIATISLFNEVHIWNRTHLPQYFEVYLKIPTEELRRRDPKGIYKRFYAGELANVAGLDLHIDEPLEANWIIDYFPERSAKELAQDLFAKIYKKDVA